jgi:hypothetical protein
MACSWPDRVLPRQRLRHERNKPLKQDRGGPSDYQMLRCHALDDTPLVQVKAQ